MTIFYGISDLTNDLYHGGGNVEIYQIKAIFIYFPMFESWDKRLPFPDQTFHVKIEVTYCIDCVFTLLSNNLT